MAWRQKHLRRLVEHRFRDISPEAARITYADGFPFGIAMQTNTAEERKFVEARAKAALDAKLAAKGNESPMTEEQISSIKIGAAFAWNETNHSNKSAIAHHVDGIRGIRGVLSAHLRAVQGRRWPKAHLPSRSILRFQRRGARWPQGVASL